MTEPLICPLSYASSEDVDCSPRCAWYCPTHKRCVIVCGIVLKGDTVFCSHPDVQAEEAARDVAPKT